MKKNFLLLVTGMVLFSGVSFAQTGKDGGKAKAKDSATVKKPMPNCPGKTCGRKKGS